MSHKSFVTISADPYRAEMQGHLQALIEPVPIGAKIKRLIEDADKAAGFKDYSLTRRYWYGLKRVDPKHLDIVRARAEQQQQAVENENINSLRCELDRHASRIAALETADREFFEPEIGGLRDQSDRLRRLSSRKFSNRDHSQAAQLQFCKPLSRRKRTECRRLLPLQIGRRDERRSAFKIGSVRRMGK